MNASPGRALAALIGLLREVALALLVRIARALLIRLALALAMFIVIALVGCAHASAPVQAVQPTGAAATPAAANPSPTLAAIRRRGAVVVGVKADYPPFGMIDPEGRPRGLEIDLANELAKRLGAELRLVPVTGANRLQRLEEGAVDVVIATLGDTAERRRVATLVEPNYYASGATLLMPGERRVRDWTEMRGHTVCAVQGSYFNRGMAQRYLLNLLVFNTSRDAKLALRDGRCAAYLFDSTAVWADLQEPAWQGYHAPLRPAMAVPWAVALSRHEAGTELERTVSDLLAQWHREGFLIARAQAWGLPVPSFLGEARELWLSTTPRGEWVCQRGAQGAWPAACRHRALLTVQDVGGLHQLGLALRERTGWDLSYVYDAFDRERLAGGLAHTVALMLACVVASLAVGVGGALLAHSKWQLSSAMVRAFALYGRMTPPLLQMYLLLFGGAAWAWALWGVQVPAWAVAVWALSHYTGASVMAALLEGARHQQRQVPGFRLRLGTLPVAYLHAAGSITASLVNVCKATMMASVIAVPELLSTATSVLVDNGNVTEVMNMLLIAFLLLIAGAVRLLAGLERWLRRIVTRAERTAGMQGLGERP